MWQELSNYLITCDVCGDTEILYEVIGYPLPQGWCREYNEDTNSAKDTCEECVKTKGL